MPDDDWKGAHLIRLSCPVSQYHQDKRQGLICSHPGCNKKLDRRNVSGRCTNHRPKKMGTRG